MMPCWRRLESTRGSFPNLKSAGCEKHEVLNHSFNLDSALPDTSALQPGTRFGCAPAPEEYGGIKREELQREALCSIVITGDNLTRRSGQPREELFASTEWEIEHEVTIWQLS
jgi:hypothetical protein